MVQRRSRVFATLAVATLLCVGFGVNGLSNTTTVEAATRGNVLTNCAGDYTTQASTLTDVNGLHAVRDTNPVPGTDERFYDTFKQEGAWEGSEIGTCEDGNGLIGNIQQFGFTYRDGIVFEEENQIEVSNISSIIFNVYIYLGKSSYVFDDSTQTGIWFYALGDTGAVGEGVKIPVGSIATDAYQDFVITGEDIAKLADENGKFSGFQFGAAFNSDINGASYIVIDYVSYTEKIAGEETKVVVTANGDYETTAGTLVDVNDTNANRVVEDVRFYDNKKAGPLPGVNLASCEDGWGFYDNIQQLGTTIFDAIVFTDENQLPINTIKSITFRIYVYLGLHKTSYTYENSENLGIWFYAIGDTGRANEGCKIPENSIGYNTYTEFTLSGSSVIKLADANGKFSGFQLATAFDSDIDANSYIVVDKISCTLKGENDNPVANALSEMTMTAGAAIRLSAAGNGIRFETNVPKTTVEMFAEYVGEDKLFNDAKFGTAIVPVDYLTEGETLETLRVAGKVAMLEARGFYEAASTEDTYKFWGSLVDIRDYNYYRAFIGVGYIKTVVDGVETYNYMEYDLNNARSLYSVAVAAYNYEGTSAEDKQLIKEQYIDTVVILSEGEAEYAGGIEGYEAPYSFDWNTHSIHSTSVIKTVISIAEDGTATIAPTAILEFSADHKSVKLLVGA